MVGDEQHDQDEEVQSDEVSRRMAEVIDEVESVKTETVAPHWEVFEDEGGGDPTIFHLHDGGKAETSIVTGDDGRRFAKCSEDEAMLDLGAAPAIARR